MKFIALFTIELVWKHFFLGIGSEPIFRKRVVGTAGECYCWGGDIESQWTVGVVREQLGMYGNVNNDSESLVKIQNVKILESSFHVSLEILLLWVIYIFSPFEDVYTVSFSRKNLCLIWEHFSWAELTVKWGSAVQLHDSHLMHGF